jgi:hypothetical protein
MKRLRLRLLTPLAAALCAFATYAQDPLKPAAEAEKPAVEAAKPEPAPARRPGQDPDPKILDGIFACIAEGLPEGWKKTWFVVKEIGRSKDGATRNFAADFFYATNVNDRKGRPLKPCGAEPVLEGVGALQDYLPDGQRRWTGATFSFMPDGKFEAKYDFTPPRPAPAKPVAKKPAPQ